MLLPLLILVLLFIATRLLRKSNFPHLPGPRVQSWAMGNLKQLFTPKGLPFHHKLVEQYGEMVRVWGFFGDAQLYITDPLALSAILGKDADAFEETDVFLETNKVIFGPGLVSTSGPQHKRQRKLVMPVLAGPHLKALVPVFESVAQRLVSAIEGALQNSDVLDMSEWASRVALETVGQSVLGYSFDPLTTHHNNPYTAAIKELIPTLFSLSLIRQFAPILGRIGSPSFRRWVALHTPSPGDSVKRVVGMSDVMHGAARDILHSKVSQDGAKDGQEEMKDITSVLLGANAKAPMNEKMTEDELTGQMTVLIFGAQDTTSSSLSRILYMLARHADIQEFTRSEIQEEGWDKEGGWLDSVIKETLRLYPPVPFVRRTCTQERLIPYRDPLSEKATAISIPKGTTLFINIAGHNRLVSVWGDDAKVWRPQRWMQADMPVGGVGIYSGILSFLGGPRSCVGYKFALVELRILISQLLLNFRFTMAKETESVVWNLSQIIGPSVVGREERDGTEVLVERKGMPLKVERVSSM